MPPKRLATPTAGPPPSSPPAVSASNDANTAKPSTAVSSKPPRPSSQNTPKSTPSKHSRSEGSSSSIRSKGRTTTTPQGRLNEAWAIAEQIWDRYANETPVRTLIIDAFMGFLVVVGIVQFLYCLLVTAYPFNAFLAGFSACVGQFVLTASLRMQTNPENRKAFEGQQDGVTPAAGEKISDERAFADFVFGSLVLHFFCVNFVN